MVKLEQDFASKVEGWESLPVEVKEGALDAAYNMGPQVFKFKGFMSALGEGDAEEAARRAEQMTPEERKRREKQAEDAFEKSGMVTQLQKGRGYQAGGAVNDIDIFEEEILPNVIPKLATGGDPLEEMQPVMLGGTV